MDSPSQDPKLSLMQLPSMDDDGGFSDNHSPIHRFTAVLTPDVHGVFSPKVLIPGVAIERPPKIRITLLSRKLVTYVLGTCIFLGVFTGVAYHGIEVYTKTQDSNDVASTEAVDAKVELFNAISGFLIALVEVMLGVYMSNFLPAFQVYLHNMLWFLHGGVAATKFSNGMRSFLMFVFPVFLMLVIGQCLRSFQASQSSVGFETIMLMEDLSYDVSVVETVKANVELTQRQEAEALEMANVTDTSPDRFTLHVLKTAVNGTASSLDVIVDSNCSDTRGLLTIGLSDLDSANVAYGFPAQEWYTEMLDVEIEKNTSNTYTFRAMVDGTRNNEPPLAAPDFDLVLASDMFASAKILLDRTVAESTPAYDECANFDTTGLETLLVDKETAKTETKKARIKCEAAYRTLYEVGNFQVSPREQQTIENLGIVIRRSLELAVDQLVVNTSSIWFSRFNVTDQVDVESMTIEATLRIDRDQNPFYEEDGDDIYQYGSFAQDLCGHKDCVFVDVNNQLELPRQIVMVPYRKNCKYNATSIKYFRNVRSFVPTDDCETVPSSALVISITSYIIADYYTSNMTKLDSSFAATPALEKPRRRLRMTINKINWRTEDVTEQFKDDKGEKELECNRREQRDCVGLSYRLTKTRRYAFVSEDAMPIEEIMNATLAEPIRLVQLNPARFYIDGLKWSDGTPIESQVTPERLSWSGGDGIYDGWSWKKKLTGTECSRYMDAYINHINRNSLYLERPGSVLYRSAMFYLFSKASITELNDTELAATAALSNSSLDAEILDKALFNIKLKGDIQYRDIRVRVPAGTFTATIVGCGLLLVIALVVVVLPKRPMEYFALTVTTPDKFIVIKNSERYPDIVHTKTLLFPASGESLPMEDFDVDEMTVVNRTDQSDDIKFWDWSH